MDSSKLGKLEKILETYVKGHLSNGGKIVPFKLDYTDGKGCCVLGTVYEFYSQNIFDIEKDLSEMLGCEFTQNDFWSFTDGFDGITNPYKMLGKDKSLYQLGFKFRNKYIKEYGE